MKKIRYSGEDLMYSVIITDTSENAINYSDVLEAVITLTNPNNVKIERTKAGGGIVEGDIPNEYVIELQDADTIRLGKGKINVRINITLTDLRFSDDEATQIIETEGFELI